MFCIVQTVQRLLRNQQQQQEQLQQQQQLQNSATARANCSSVPAVASTSGTCVDCGTSMSPVHVYSVCCGAEDDENSFSRLELQKPLRASMQELQPAASASTIGPPPSTTTAAATTPAGDLKVRAPDPKVLAIETHTMEIIERRTFSRPFADCSRQQAPPPPDAAVTLVAQVPATSRPTNAPLSKAFVPKGSSSDSAQTSPGSGSGSASGCSSCASGSRSGPGPTQTPATSSSANEKGRGHERCSCATCKKGRGRRSKKMPEICRGSGGKGDYNGLAGQPCPPSAEEEADDCYTEDHPHNGLPRFCKCWIFCMKQG